MQNESVTAFLLSQFSQRTLPQTICFFFFNQSCPVITVNYHFNQVMILLAPCDHVHQFINVLEVHLGSIPFYWMSTVSLTSHYSQHDYSLGLQWV